MVRLASFLRDESLWSPLNVHLYAFYLENICFNSKKRTKNRHRKLGITPA
jgi:hypothetical protein